MQHIYNNLDLLPVETISVDGMPFMLQCFHVSSNPNVADVIFMELLKINASVTGVIQRGQVININIELLLSLSLFIDTYLIRHSYSKLSIESFYYVFLECDHFSMF
ncbi:hypothetical protein NM688_g1762 [Phlebia brevispora]|uniref:Uncharacterized protein n=1 Tax=Phlebia brevispora TaxID=194682 RepID=A0ACC1TAH8_9APHY|nr:hypothetical protein NM688_g1762 [Phlebia brevispora]